MVKDPTTTWWEHQGNALFKISAHLNVDDDSAGADGPQKYYTENQNRIKVFQEQISKLREEMQRYASIQAEKIRNSSVGKLAFEAAYDVAQKATKEARE